MHKSKTIITVLVAVLVFCAGASAQNSVFQNVGYGQTGSSQQKAPQAKLPSTQGYDVFVPISKYITQGNADALSAWFAENLEMSVLSQGGDASRAQARQIMKSFFENHTPRSFTITHTAGRGNMKYALGELKAGGETFNVTVFVNCKDGKNQIQQLKIERF